MGTMADSVSRVSQASSDAILIMIGLRGEYDGRETITCEACGRAQFNREQAECIACHVTLTMWLEPLEPLPTESDAEATMEVEPDGQGRRACLRLRELRRLLGISQPQLADAAGCARTLITKYENGAVCLTINSFDRLARGFHLTLSEIFDERITLEELAVRSLIRSPGDGELIATIIKCLPRLDKHNRLDFLNTVSLLASRNGRR
jgi:transcriptional regulator with XRE-family HTH domain